MAITTVMANMASMADMVMASMANMVMVRILNLNNSYKKVEDASGCVLYFLFKRLFKTPLSIIG